MMDARDVNALPRVIRMTASDNVAIVVNDGGLPAGTRFDDGLTLLDKVPQGHKVTLCDLKKGEAVLRYNVPIGYAKQDIAAGRWYTSACWTCPPRGRWSVCPWPR